MTQTANGGPAFPFQANDASNIKMQTNGMTLRDYFAGQALAGINANQAWDANGWADRAYHAYASADAMLAARVQS